MFARSPSARRIVPVLAAALALVAAACTDPPTTGGSGGQVVEAGNGQVKLPECPLKALDDATGRTKVTMWYGGIGGPVEDTLQAMVKNFNASQDKVTIQASNQGASNAEVYRKFESAASANSKQLPDILYAENTQLQVLSDSNLILPAQSCMEADGYDEKQIIPAVRSAFSVGDVLYPGYMNVSSQVLYYNKAHFLKAGLDPEKPPQTLAEVHDAAVKLKKAGIPKPLSFKTSHAVFENWLSGEGVDVVNHSNGHDGRATAATFDTPEARANMEWLQKMNEEGLLNPFANTEGSIDHFLALVTQQSSMLIETSTASSTFAQAISGALTPEDVGSNFDASVIDKSQLVPGTGSFPGPKAAGKVHPGGSAFFIVNAGPKAEQAGAWEFMKFMLQPENAKAWHTKGGYLPTVKAVEDEPDVQKFWTDDLAGVLVKPAVDQLDEADPDDPGPLIGPYTDFTDYVQKAMEGVLFNHEAVGPALAKAQGQVTASLKRYAGT
jgi:sn-glycerol 3-phosphate transport system substrate-binding protein